ncbi:hypothetical protein TPY_1012 [Sulfobacillus acidophilus TPY]|uniref:Uncharacterized protein n=1 Tax=Sulfobacillus acidophilus (strain ATCC 700253 / DSM 10332 / NAL) TaxID=679936 RepID=G8TX93_SULAD|nr:hypothetical protein TPY_1012 [Sulfobacillus acidophilus TPY]AEW06095.1 hypothetical protein Sulac_2633 [Sulfobacillus acidophilus DSM 10332]
MTNPGPARFLLWYAGWGALSIVGYWGLFHLFEHWEWI